MRRTCATAPVASNGHGSPRSALQHGSHHCTALCLGHQVVCSAHTKAWQGHRGAKNPALYLCCRAVLVVPQNHGYATAPSTLGDGVEVTHISLIAQTIQGLRDPAACKVVRRPSGCAQIPLAECLGSDVGSVAVLGAGPITIGQGIEFDDCCVHATATAVM